MNTTNLTMSNHTESCSISRSVREIEVLLRARYPVLYVVTWEEGRVEDALAKIAHRRERKLFTWSVARGIQQFGTPLESSRTRPGAGQGTHDPAVALDHVLQSLENGIYVFRDLHVFLTDCPNQAPVVRRVRELASYLKQSYKTLVIVGPTLKLPMELQKDVTVLEWDLPDKDDLGDLMDRTLDEVNESTGRQLRVTDIARERILSAASGLTLNEAENVFAKTLVLSGGLTENDLPIILSEKEQMIRKSGLLEYYHASADFGQIGGLDLLKGWLARRSVAFDSEATEFGLPAPRGVLLIGVQGCGKSLTAKAIAGLWGLPLLRLDVGRLYSSLVGSSEENVRMAIRVAESASPAVLWVDEIEKSMAGSQSSGNTDGGTAARVLSTFLTWLQEKTAPVFVVATANSIESLPPELLRRGRLDETFFVDLPDTAERAEIFRIHLKRRGRDPEAFDLTSLAADTAGFSGAEIEQTVIAALFDAYSAGDSVGTRILTTDILRRAVADTVPLSRTMKEPIQRLREWADGRARPASSRDEPATPPAWIDTAAPAGLLNGRIGGGRRLEIED